LYLSSKLSLLALLIFFLSVHGGHELLHKVIVIKLVVVVSAILGASLSISDSASWVLEALEVVFIFTIPLLLLLTVIRVRVVQEVAFTDSLAKKLFQSLKVFFAQVVPEVTVHA
jgi:hypothetical protein